MECAHWIPPDPLLWPTRARQHINHNAYIVTCIESTGFCHSAFTAVDLIISNLAEMVAAAEGAAPPPRPGPRGAVNGATEVTRRFLLLFLAASCYPPPGG